jgi:uncharacterized protein YqiB (DUF1249 family)
MTKNVYESIFTKLQTLGILDENGKMQAEYMKFKSSGLMDLNVDNLTNDMIALAHNGIQNGDVMADPDVQVQIYPGSKTAEALTFQNDYLGIYQEVYDDGKCNESLKKDLNEFLNDWLKTITEVQEYHLAETE